MKKQFSRQVRLGGSIALLLLLPAVSAHARSRKSEAWARNRYEAASRLQDALNAEPAKARTRAEYQKVINAYRSVYFGSPASGKAAPSVAAVAELMVEMGRRFDDDDILRHAIRQFEFLRAEYPGSGDRFSALYTIGEIYKDDLNDYDHAQKIFEEFVKRYPNHHLADDARNQLQELQQQAEENATDAKAAGDTDAASSSPDSAKSASAEEAPGGLTEVTAIRHWSTPDYTRIAVDLGHDVKYEAQTLTHPERIYFDLLGTELSSSLADRSLDVNDGVLSKIRIAEFAPGRTRLVLEVKDDSEYNAFLLSDPARLVIDVHSKDIPVKDASAAKDSDTGGQSASASKKTVVEADDDDSAPLAASADVKRISDSDDNSGKRSRGHSPVRSTKGRHATAAEIREAQPTANGDRSLVRALGLKIGKIVIDPGHGGHDTGTIGPHGLLEKDLVLDVAHRLGKLLDTRLGAQVIYTRSDDTFVPLETRTAIANQEQADLFVSIHANSSRDRDARGVETYYLNFTSSEDALEVAARENAVSEKSIHELQDLVKKIALRDKIDESREFAGDVQHALYNGLGTKNTSIRDRGVKKAPFIVLIGANMPSILAEISFVSNPVDERHLRTAAYRQKIAESLYRGISRYVSGLGGVKVASQVDKGAGQ